MMIEKNEEMIWKMKILQEEYEEKKMFAACKKHPKYSFACQFNR